MFTGMPDFKQSMEMMKNMWANAAKGSADSPTGFSMPGMQGFNSMGIPTMDIDLDMIQGVSDELFGDENPDNDI